MLFLKVIACEIVFREACYLAARSPNLVDLEFLPQGLHDTPHAGSLQVQQRIDAVPGGKYDALLLGYGLCGNILRGLRARHTPLVVPRAHDCITLFVGSKDRYQQLVQERPGTYYYTSGWLECLRRRGEKGALNSMQFLPTRAGIGGNTASTFEDWARRYGHEQARYLLEVMDQWTSHYTHGVLIDFDFTKVLDLRGRVQQICADRGWQYEEMAGDLGLLQRWLEGRWDTSEFLTVPPGGTIVPTYGEDVIGAAETAPPNTQATAS